jgi:hypothetical protein
MSQPIAGALAMLVVLGALAWALFAPPTNFRMWVDACSAVLHSWGHKGGIEEGNGHHGELDDRAGQGSDLDHAQG